jgi:hypothetical protein
MRDINKRLWWLAIHVGFSQGYVIWVFGWKSAGFFFLAASMRKIHAVTQPAVTTEEINVTTRGSLKRRNPGQ